MNFLRKAFFVLFFLGLAFVILAQDQQKGEVDIIGNSRIDSLIKIQRIIGEYNIAHEEHDGIDGYRIQLFFESGNNSKSRAYEIRDKFVERYRNIPAYVIFGEPYYRLRVGDFRTRLEAEGFLKRIIRRYPNAWVTTDKIKFPALN